MKKFKSVLMILICLSVALFSACDVSGTVPPTAEPTNTPTPPLSDSFTKCTIVLDDEARIYTKNAAQRLKEFIEPHLSVEIKSTHSHVQGELTVYVGDSGKNSGLWQEFNKNGYVIYQKDGEAVLCGSNAENTYIAVSRYIKQILNDDARNICREELSITSEIGDRADYIADISKFQTVWQYDWQAPEWSKDFTSKITTLLNSNARPITYGHRGDVEHYPENSIEGIISAINKGIDLVEVDVYLTADGVLVLNHGDDLRTTTDWAEKHGKTIDGVALPNSFKLEKWTYEQLSKLCLRAGNGGYSEGKKSEISDYRIATLEEVFTVCNERCFVIIDKLSKEHWDKVLDIIKKTNAGRCFIYVAMAESRTEASEMKAQVREALGVAGPSWWECGRGWSGTWYDEFDLTTREQFDQYYKQQIAIGTIVSTNRITRLMDYIDRTYYAEK